MDSTQNQNQQQEQSSSNVDRSKWPKEERDFPGDEACDIDDRGFSVSPNGSFWTEDQKYFNRNGFDIHGGSYDAYGFYQPGPGYDQDNMTYEGQGVKLSENADIQKNIQEAEVNMLIDDNIIANVPQPVDYQKDEEDPEGDIAEEKEDEEMSMETKDPNAKDLDEEKELTKYINDTKDYIIKSETKYKSSMEQEPKIGLTVPVQCPKSNLKANVKMGLNNFAPIKVSDENESNAV